MEQRLGNVQTLLVYEMLLVGGTLYVEEDIYPLLYNMNPSLLLHAKCEETKSIPR